MLNTNHPDEELLSALASDDAEAVENASLAAHVTSCVGCTSIVDDLRGLRASLADLPDLHPHRPLRLLPVAPSSRIDRLGWWARRAFGPVLAAGATLAFVGVVGTAAPAFSGMAASGAAPSTADFERSSAEVGEPVYGGATASQRDAQAGAEGNGSVDSASDGDGTARSSQSTGIEEQPQPSVASEPLVTETARSPWPMVLFAGVALMIGAALLRWILVPRAG
jgi:hypothetical protein